MKSVMATQQLIAWLEFLFIWAFLSFGIITDRKYEGRTPEGSARWQFGLACRAIAILAFTAWFCGSWTLGAIAGAALIVQTQTRYRISNWPIASECIPPIAVFFLGFVLVERQSISPQRQISLDIDTNHLAALLIIGITFCLALRWGAFLVKSILKLAMPTGKAVSDPNEIERGFLIGILERMLLTIVVALGSFSALGFLVAAKGLVRSHQFEGQDSRDFTEYFLIGTLASTLIAVCAGLIIRGALHCLWPELLLLDMKSD